MIPTQPNTTPKSLYNPLTEDFSDTRADENNNPVTYTLRAQEIDTFPTYIANHILKHLAQHIVLKRGVKTNYIDEYNAVVKEIEVNLDG